MTGTTQTRHPWRATIRTAFAVLVAAATLIPYIVAETGLDTVPAIAQVAAVASGVTRVLALPKVDEFLRRFLPWLASAPAVEPSPDVYRSRRY